MDARLLPRRATTALGTRSVPEAFTAPMLPSAAASSGGEWAQNELSSYFRSHPEKLSLILDRVMNKLRICGGDMGPFIAEMDTIIDTLNEDIDDERREMAGRTTFMRDHPDVTNDFLHFFLDGVMEAVEREQSQPGGSRGKAPQRRCSTPAGGAPVMPRAGASSSAGKERFASATKRMPL